MARVLIIGAGGVGAVVTHKCAQVPEVFEEIMLASRTREKCLRIQDSVWKKYPKTRIRTAELDADQPESVATIINYAKADLVINVALPYQDLSIMDACLETGVSYLDTANYEPRDEAKFCYKWQWDYHDRFKQKGLMALLGCGFDPGVTNIFIAHALKHHFSVIYYVDITDCNAGNHGHPFATNFNPEINIREVTQPARYWEDGEWKEADSILSPYCISRTFDFPEIGPRKMYLLYHEEIESLAKNIPGVKRIRFWMTFGQEYLNYLSVLQNVGMTRIDPILFEGQEIVPLQFLKAILPEPSSLGANYHGKTNIGCLIEGIGKDGQPKKYYIYNVCDHAEAYREVKAQAISYTTGVPAMIGGMMMLTGTWKGNGIFNVEEFDPDPFMKKLDEYGLPWTEKVLE